MRWTLSDEKSQVASWRQSITDLIMTPLQAVYEAQEKLALATATYIEKVGLLSPSPVAGSDGLGADAGVVSFRFQRPAAAQSSDGSGQMATEAVEINVPLLAIVKIPTLSISKIDFSFSVGGAAAEEESSTQHPVPAHASPLYNVHVHAEQSEPSEALARVLDLMANALVVQPTVHVAAEEKNNA